VGPVVTKTFAPCLFFPWYFDDVLLVVISFFFRHLPVSQSLGMGIPPSFPPGA